MVNKLLFLAIFLFLSCGKDGGEASNADNVNSIGQPDVYTGYITVAQAQVTISNGASVSRFINLISPINTAYAATTNAVVTYTYSLIGSIALGALNSVSDSVNDSPSFGQVNVTSFDSNNLRLCSGGSRCPYAQVRAYVSSISSNFDSYGGKVKIGSNVLPNSGTPVNLITGTISTNRIRSSSPSQNPFLPGSPSLATLGELILDLSDANTGAYSVTVTIELAIGE